MKILRKRLFTSNVLNPNLVAKLVYATHSPKRWQEFSLNSFNFGILLITNNECGVNHWQLLRIKHWKIYRYYKSLNTI